MTKQASWAKAIRIISIPPVMVTVLIFLLYSFRNNYFHHPADMVISFLFLGIIPVLAYPLQKFIPQFKNTGRAGQRKLAFITNLIGYSITFIRAVVSRITYELFLLCATYFFSVVILTMCNRIHFNASGHAGSFTGALVMLVYAFNWKLLFPGIVIASLIIWSSLTLKRHTINQLVAGIV